MSEEYNDSTTQQSEFNSALSIIYRLNDLTVASHRYALQSNFINWNFCLDRMWRELVADASDEQQQFFIKIDDLFNKSYINYKNNKINKRQIYLLLNLKEDFIRVVQNGQGKGNSYQDDIEDYME